jgi:putative phage-type endonuclease
MPKILAYTGDMDRLTWLQMRRHGIGGSDVAAIAGLSKYKSEMQVYLEKVGDWEITDEMSEAAYWGTVMEDLIAKEFTERTGITVRRKRAILQHDQYPWMIANLDRIIIGENAGLEIKTASEYMRDQWEDDQIPLGYMLQCQHYIEVCGFDYMYIAVLIGGNKFRYKRVERDQEIIDSIIKIEADFWKLVESKTPPAIDGSEATVEVLKTLYPESRSGTVIQLPDDFQYLLQQREIYVQDKKELELKIDEIDNRIKSILGENEIGIVGDKKVTWKTSMTLDEETLQKTHPELYNAYLVPTFDRKAFEKANKQLAKQFRKPKTRVFKISQIKEDEAI